MLTKFKASFKLLRSDRIVEKLGAGEPITVDINNLCIRAFLQNLSDEKPTPRIPPPPLENELKVRFDNLNFTDKTIH